MLLAVLHYSLVIFEMITVTSDSIDMMPFYSFKNGTILAQTAAKFSLKTGCVPLGIILI